MAREKSGYKYGVEQLAKHLDILPASVRVALRKANVKKTKEGVYGWNSEKEMKAVAAKIATDAPKGKKEKPAKKGKKGKKKTLKIKNKAKSEPADEGSED